MFITVPTYTSATEEWSHREFETREEFVDFMWSLFKEPGQYDFDEDSLIFKEQAFKFNKHKVYCIAPDRSKDYRTYWDAEKDKCRNGVIVIGKKNTWYLTRYYYMWLNFMPLYNKEISRFGFPDVRDAQYHLALYEEIARFSFKHAAILKKRQIASSYFHAGVMINNYFFEEGSVNKMAGSLKDYIAEKGTWRFLEEYRNFLNTYTAWYRPSTPDKVLNWEQKVEMTQGGKKRDVGLKSVIIGLVLEKDPTNGVGGPCLKPGTKILMYDTTYKTVENIIVGDLVSGADGNPKKVLNLFEGVTDMYEVSQTKGNTYITTADHTLYLWSHDKKNYSKVKTKDFNNLSEYQRTRKLSGIKFNGLIFSEQVLPIDPYYLGLYLGDGCKYDYSIIVNNDKDPEIAEYINELCIKENHQLKLKHKNKYRTDYNNEMLEMSLGVGSSRLPDVLKNSYVTKLKFLKVKDKHIPEMYMKSSKQQRLQLIAGLLDTDGYYNNKKNRFEITLHHKRLSDDLIKLCIITGLDAHSNNVYTDGKRSTVNAGETVGIRINITGNIKQIPVNIIRKKVEKNGIKNVNRYSKLKVKALEQGQYYGFECEDNLFVLEDGTITHNCTFFFHEEAGVAPRMNETIEYLLPAMKSGMTYTGFFAVAGSVGDLEQCEPLRKMIMTPDTKDVLAVKTNLINPEGDEGMCGLFIPEQWSMQPCIDDFGNSEVEKAVEMILKEREDWKTTGLDPEDYQLRISQKPINIKEAFDYRKESRFPLHLVTKQTRRIEDGEYFKEYVDLFRNERGQIEIKESRKLPIMEFPISPKVKDKEGVIVIYERPCKNPQFAVTYYASVDPVSEGKTTTSESLCSIFVYKTRQEVTITKEDGSIEQRVERDGIVASWCGRFDDLNKTHERLEMLIELYNAWTIVENNIGLFIQYMISKRKQKYLVPKSQISFLKELNSNVNVFQEYGWKNTGTIFKAHLVSYAVQFLEEELDVETTADGTIIKTTFGVERIPDIMLLKEMAAYRDGINVDRMVAFCALVAFAKVQESNRGYGKRVEKEENNLQYSNKNRNLFHNPFKNIGSLKQDAFKKPRMAFKNYK